MQLRNPQVAHLRIVFELPQDPVGFAVAFPVVDTSGLKGLKELTVCGEFIVPLLGDADVSVVIEVVSRHQSSHALIFSSSGTEVPSLNSGGSGWSFSSIRQIEGSALIWKYFLAIGS